MSDLLIRSAPELSKVNVEKSVLYSLVKANEDALKSVTNILSSAKQTPIVAFDFLNYLNNNLAIETFENADIINKLIENLNNTILYIECLLVEIKAGGILFVDQFEETFQEYNVWINTLNEEFEEAVQINKNSNANSNNLEEINLIISSSHVANLKQSEAIEFHSEPYFVKINPSDLYSGDITKLEQGDTVRALIEVLNEKNNKPVLVLLRLAPSVDEDNSEE